MFTIAATTPVHTTGINIESVAAITASIAAVLTIIGGLIGRYIAGRITTAISKFQDAVVDKLDTRLTVVETKLDIIHRDNPA